MLSHGGDPLALGKPHIIARESGNRTRQPWSRSLLRRSANTGLLSWNLNITSATIMGDL